jgi:hypothetical protein
MTSQGGQPLRRPVIRKGTRVALEIAKVRCRGKQAYLLHRLTDSPNVLEAPVRPAPVRSAPGLRGCGVQTPYRAGATPAPGPPAKK